MKDYIFLSNNVNDYYVRKLLTSQCFSLEAPSRVLHDVVN